MNGAIYPIMSGSIAQEHRLATVMNNIANLETAGYRKDRPVFEMMPFTEAAKTVHRYDQMRFPTVGVMVHAEPDLSAGKLRQTEDSTDLAIDGEGFFAVETGEGTRYTRTGKVTRDERGVLTTKEGFPIHGKNGRITVPEGELIVRADGKIAVKLPGKDKDIVIDTLKLVTFDTTREVRRVGTTLLDGTPLEARATGSIRQGFREDSNVNPFHEIQAMIDAVRAYQAAQKVITTIDESTGKAIEGISGN